MQINQLYYLIEISKTKSITHAAENLHVAQQSISLAIIRLEKELGVTMFNRSHHGVTFTKEGEIVLEKAKNIINQVEELTSMFTSDRPSLKGNLIIHTSAFVGITILPDILFGFLKQNPNVHVKITERETLEIFKAAQKGEFDIGFFGRYHKNVENDNNCHILQYDSLIACVSKLSPLAKNESISLKQLLKHPLVVFSQKQEFISFLEKYGKPNIVLMANNYEVFKQAIIEGVAVGIYLSLEIKREIDFTQGKIVSIPIRDDCKMAYGWIHPENVPISKVTQEFINYLNLYGTSLGR
ncbi:LysR family transcriptional regulator [Desulfitobacterium sp. Sab5]|uniref:LysR family transcriptional regulator n=1 Tax=Desulfitobacterium TaxID=36853 RepID=UPI003CFADB9F